MDTFECVELKHIITAKDTDGKFSYHLVRIALGCSIGNHMRRSAFFPGRPGGLITEITWKAGRLEVICEWGYRTKDVHISFGLRVQ